MTANFSMEAYVKNLARDHFALEQNLNSVIWFKDKSDKHIRIIEVNPDTFETGKVMIFSFGKTSELPFPLHIAEVTPEEWEKVRDREIRLPEDWNIDDIEVIQRDKAPN